MHAARQGAGDAVRALLDHRADSNLRDPDGTTALVLAIINAHYDVASLLLDRGANPNIPDQSGMAALYALVDMHTLAGMQGRPTPKLVDQIDTVGLLRKLIAKGADPNARLGRPLFGRHHGSGDPVLGEGTTPLLRAAKAIDTELMAALLDGGADAFAAKGDGLTALMLVAAGQVPRNLALSPAAASERVIVAARLLLERGVDVNAFNRAGQTALHIAAERGSDVLVQFLADHGAEPDVRDRQGRTPLELASSGRKDQVARNAARERTVALLQKLHGTDDLPCGTTAGEGGNACSK
jgi:ankyrin repeat protein